ncbi:fibronectin type III domain-containing protein [Geodermatophilus sp. SYSU D00703]
MTNTRRRSPLVGAVLALTVLIGLTSVVTAAPASAALTAPAARIAFGDRSLTLAWDQVRGATSYQVQYSLSSSFSKPVTVDAGARSWLQVRGLQNDTRYYARVVAVAGSGRAASRTLSASPDNGYPRQLTVSVVPAGRDAVRVSWTGQGRATKVVVLAGSNSTVDRHSFNSGWLPATTTSVVLTVPAAYRSVLGTGSGNPVFVKVGTYNDLSAGSAVPLVRNEAAAYRLSLAGPHTQVGTVAPAGTRLRVAEYNVNSVGASAGFRGYTWRDRRTKVAAAIEASGAALLGTAELATSDAGLGNGKKQWEDLRDLLAQSRYGGYAIANTVTAATRNGDTNATVGAHLFYDPDLLTREAGAFVSPKGLMGSAWPAGLTDRYFSWARFRVNATGARFYAVAVHLPSRSEPLSYPKLRTKEVAAIDTHMSRIAGSTPMVLLGDLNSAFADDPGGPASFLLNRGYYDAAATTSRTNARYNTVNTSKQVDNLAVPGYPTRPYAYQYPAPRIDYVMTKNAPGSWRYTNQVLLTDGRFTPAYQGSDHNLQWAEIGIR